MGAVTPLATNLKSSWLKLCSNQPTVKNITSLEEALKFQNLPRDLHEYELEMSEKLPCQVAAPIKSLENIFAYDTRTARFVQFALAAANEATLQADLPSYLGLYRNDNDDNDPHRLINPKYQHRRDRSGVCIGSGIGSVRDFTLSTLTINKRGVARINPHFVPRVLTNSASGRVALEYKLAGPNHTASTACAAGAHSIGDAVRFIQSNAADVMLAGGAEASIDVLSLAGFCKLRALSKNSNDAPDLSSRPFDSDRDGFVMGEGAAVLVLEELEHARARGAEANILCEVTGYGLSGDAYHVIAPDPQGRGAQRAMRMALDDANNGNINIGNNNVDGTRRSSSSPAAVVVDYVNCHATSTPVGDMVELYAIQQTLLQQQQQQHDNDHPPPPPLFIGSTKGATGHLLGAAGALEAAFSVMSIVDNVIPPTRNLQTVDDKATSLLGDNGNVRAAELVMESSLLKGEDDVEVNTVMSNSFGFGGTNVSLIFSAFSDER